MVDLPADITGYKPFGVAVSHERVYLYLSSTNINNGTLLVDTSYDGIHFSTAFERGEIRENKVRVKNTGKIIDARISAISDKFLLTYKYSIKNLISTYSALSHDLVHWRKYSKFAGINETCVVVPHLQHKGQYVSYYGDTDIKVAYSKDLKHWQLPSVVLQPKADFFGQTIFQVAQVWRMEEGIVLLYYIRSGKAPFVRYAIKTAIFDQKDPGRLIRDVIQPIWESGENWQGQAVKPLGVVEYHDTLISYWWNASQGLKAITHPFFSYRLHKQTPKPHYAGHLVLNKYQQNPILEPIAEHFWESRATFNPAAVYADDKVHLVYRAIGDHDISVLGYAVATDGIHIDKRFTEPIYIPTQQFESNQPYTHASPNSSPYASGGGVYGGCEDPRISQVGNRFYMTYVAYDGWCPPRIALTSITVADFLNHNWSWETPVLISAPGVVNKNACILPEKVHNKYVVFHRIYPDILIDYVDSLDFSGEKYLTGHDRICPRSGLWDSRKIGVGAPPIKTPEGWLLIYQSVGEQDAARYKIGAMLLDLENPARVLHRSVKPILEPNAWYENQGHKAGVAYPCGAVWYKPRDELIVYYGGADTVVCTATAKMDQFLTHLTAEENAELQPVESRVSLN